MPALQLNLPLLRAWEVKFSITRGGLVNAKEKWGLKVGYKLQRQS